MKYWCQILNEVKSYKVSNIPCVFTNLRESGHFEETHVVEDINTIHTATLEKKSYYLSPDSSGTYLTQREAECIFFLLKGHTIKNTGEELNLSPRTVEFYFKNVKKKMRCNKKKEVLNKIRQSHFDSSGELAKKLSLNEHL